MHQLPRVVMNNNQRHKNGSVNSHSQMTSPVRKKPSALTLSHDDSSQKLMMPSISQTPLFNASALQQHAAWTDAYNFP